MKNKISPTYYICVLTLYILFTNLKISAQPAIMWQNTIGSTANDVLYDLIQTNDGGYVMSGFNTGGVISGEKTVTGSC